MSYHVYVARPVEKGQLWRDRPILESEWVDAIGRCPELEVRPVENRKRSAPPIAHLRGRRRQWLHLHDGFILAQDPEEPLVAVMFALAQILDARVYSERAKPYASVDDWERRTRDYRTKRDQRRRETRRRDRLRVAGFLVAIAAGVFLFGWLRGLWACQR